MNIAKFLSIAILIQFTWILSLTQHVTISPEGQVVVAEGGSLNITCTDGTDFEHGNALVIDKNGVQDNSITRKRNGSEVIFFLGPFTFFDDGTVFRCRHLLVSQTISSNVFLLVQIPIIQNASIQVLNVSHVVMNITLSPYGHQIIMYYEVTINERTVRYNSSDTQVSFISDGYHLFNNVFNNATIVVMNSVGLSNPHIHSFFVPNPPSITMAPTSLDPSAIQTCCAGVKLNLEDPDDPTLVVKVYRNEVQHPSTSREGDNLFIPGLQAGREYTFRVSVENVFGTSEHNVTVTPLLGRPSNPARPTVTTDGTTVTVVLSTDYPGTERMRSGSIFSFQLHLFTKDGRSARQSDTQVVSATPSGLSSPVTTTYQGVLSGGRYTVQVTAVNEHGSSESVVSEEFVVTEISTPVTSPNAPVVSLHIIIIPAVIAAGLLVLFVVVLTVCFIALRKESGLFKSRRPQEVDKKCNPSYVDKGIEHRASRQDDIILQKNPAYESVDHNATYANTAGGRRGTQ